MAVVALPNQSYRLPGLQRSADHHAEPHFHKDVRREDRVNHPAAGKRLLGATLVRNEGNLAFWVRSIGGCKYELFYACGNRSIDQILISCEVNTFKGVFSVAASVALRGIRGCYHRRYSFDCT